MFLALWNYLHGYVIINVSGFSVERFVNMAAHRGIYLWDACPEGAGVTMKVSIKGFKQLKEAARKTGCRVKIIGRRGFPFFLSHYEKRKVLGLGVFAFIVGLYILSSFVWVVHVEGTQRLTKEQILSACDELGLAAGKWKPRIDTKTVSDELLLKFEDISWVSVRIQGTNATIRIVETIPKTEIVDRTTPTNIIAKKDGIITGMATSSGTPLVKPGDVVEAGDILVTGEVDIVNGDVDLGKEYVRSQSEITAKVWYTLTEEISVKYTQRNYTGKIKKDKSLLWYDKSINVVQPNLDEGQFERTEISKKILSIGDYQFPVAIVEDEYREYTEEEKTKTKGEAEEEITKLLSEKTEKILEGGGQLFDSAVEYTQEEGKVKAEATLTVIERIDQEQPMTEDGRNTEDGTENGISHSGE